MTGPNLATRMGAALARRRPEAPPEPAAPQPPRPPALHAGPKRPPPAGARATRGLAVLRRHWLFGALLAAGLVLRVLATIAYHPALIYVDTLKYLYGASPGSEPFGYSLALKIVLAVGDLGTVAVAQHLLGLAMAAAIYLVLLRRGIPRWLAALTTAPVLLDAYQLQMEQTIMPDVLFEAIVVAGLAVLLWRPVLTARSAAAAGLILAASATVMQLGVVLVVPAAIYTLALGGGWRRSGRFTAALVLAFAAVILGYCTASYAHDGHFWLARRQSLTGRLVGSADCATLKLSATARAVCPTPAQRALGPDWLEHSGQSPLFHNALPAGPRRSAAIADLKAAVLGQQPQRVLAAIVRDAVRLYALTRDGTPGVTPIGRWQFQDGYPEYPPWVNVCSRGRYVPAACMAAQQALQQRVAPVSDLLVRPDGAIVIGVQRQVFEEFHAKTLNPGYGGPAQVNRPVAEFLRAYQLSGGYTPGPLLALCTLAGLAGSAVLLRRRLPVRARQLGLACLLFTGTAVVLLFAPDVYQFSWRYELPAVITLVPAGVLGAVTLVSLRGAGRPAPGGPVPAAGPPAGAAPGPGTVVVRPVEAEPADTEPPGDKPAAQEKPASDKP